MSRSRITMRAWQSEDDYERVRELLRESFALTGPPDYCTRGDLDWWRYTDEDPDEITRSSRLWIDDYGTFVGFAWASDDQLDMMAHPHHRGIESEMIDFSEQRAREKGHSFLTVWSYDNDTTRTGLLQSRGYTRQDGDGLNYRVRSLRDTIPDATLPPGYVIRNVRDEDDLERRVAVHRDAFSPSRMTVEKHRRVMQSPTYRQDLDLVVEAPDGSFAAFCILWHDEPNRNAVFEPVGTHSAHRRLGLARAVMYEGMRRVRTLGAETVCVVSHSGAAAANRLYESAGFSFVDRNSPWSKQE